ncbi:MAG: YvcK family protein [Chloroflexi bacterium]|nr:YvcK family protein [Chloroflexota bacterium]
MAPRAWLRRISTALNDHPRASAFLVLLVPGLSLKRWLALGVFGLGAIALGIVFALELSLGPRFHSIVGLLSLRESSATVRGGAFIAIGVVGAVFAVFGLGRSLSRVRLRRRDRTLLDSLYVERVLSGGPKVVVIGGGSGLPNLLRGLKYYTSNLTAVVTVADDGGSSGRLRSELGILPPGDIRNCLVALADSEVVMQQLMDYRFSTNGQLDGHSFGNMLIAALAGIGGDFSKGVEIAGELLAIRGRVIPSTSTDIVIVGSTISGQMLLGESRVGTATERLRSIALVPADAPVHPDAAKAIKEADLIILGPGSLFTSIVPNLLVRDLAAALAGASGLKMYICNVAEEPGQTTGYSVLDHLNVVRHYAGDDSVNIVIANDNGLQDREPPSPSLIPARTNWQDDIVCIWADVIDEEIPTRHDPVKLAATVASTYQKHRGSRRRLPLLHRDLH